MKKVPPYQLLYRVAELGAAHPSRIIRIEDLRREVRISSGQGMARVSGAAIVVIREGAFKDLRADAERRHDREGASRQEGSTAFREIRERVHDRP